MPWYAVALMLGGPVLIVGIRIYTWLARRLCSEQRPGYLPIGRRR
jgi:hypothetical protein